MTRRRDLTPDEARLWGRVARSARPLHAHRLAPAPAPVPLPASDTAAGPEKAAPRGRAAPAATQTVPAPLPVAGAAGAVADASGHKPVRRGKLDIDARIDLHGLRQHEAEVALAGFVARCRDAGMRCVLVITGKGRPAPPDADWMAPAPGVIRRRLPDWLRSPHLRPHLSGWASAHARHGGEGAVYLLLKARGRG